MFAAFDVADNRSRPAGNFPRHAGQGRPRAGQSLEAFSSAGRSLSEGVKDGRFAKAFARASPNSTEGTPLTRATGGGLDKVIIVANQLVGFLKQKNRLKLARNFYDPVITAEGFSTEDPRSKHLPGGHQGPCPQWDWTVLVSRRPFRGLPAKIIKTTALPLLWKQDTFLPPSWKPRLSVGIRRRRGERSNSSSKSLARGQVHSPNWSNHCGTVILKKIPKTEYRL